MKKLWTALMGMLCLTTSCKLGGGVGNDGGRTDEPDAELVECSYQLQGMMMYPIMQFELTAQPGDSTRLVYTNEADTLTRMLPAEVMDSVRAIVRRERLYQLKRSYTPKYEVLDGEMWNFHLTYSNGETVSSGGSNAWPRHHSLKPLTDYVKQYMK